MGKIDFKKHMKVFYNPSSKEVSLVKVPKMNFIMIDGKGDPNTSGEFRNAIEILYPVAYNIKFGIKRTQNTDYVVPPLEALWWADDMRDFDPETTKKDNWRWTAMIMQPQNVTKDIYQKALTTVGKSKNQTNIDRIRFESFEEGESAQIMHIGPFSTEGPNIQRIHDKIRDLGGSLSGKHHEIYISDYRKIPPERMRTIIRQAYIGSKKS